MLLTACAWICAPAASAHAQIAFAPCGDSNDFACGHLTVPLDPTGATPGTITLALRRHRAPVGEARSAIIALAGGPGQPALPFAEAVRRTARPDRRDARSDRLRPARDRPVRSAVLPRLRTSPACITRFGALIEACGDQLGPTRTFYTTADTVADIEAIRQAGGYEKLVLYGTSYGTKVAEQYAQDYPSHVEALVLDSVVPPNGPEPLDRSTFAAVPRILRQLCAEEACAHITSNPVADLARVVKRMDRAPLHGRAIDEDGKAHQVALSSDELLEILLAGDFSPLLRAEFVTAVAAAARDDTAPLARLIQAAGHAVGEGESEDFDTPLYYATTCEEQDFPWSRAVDPKARIAEASRRRQGAAGKRVRALHRDQRARCQRHPGMRLLAVHHARPAPRRRAPAGRPDVDPQRGRRPAHPDRKRPRSGGRRSPTRTCWSCPTPATRCSPRSRPRVPAKRCRRCSRPTPSSRARQRPRQRACSPPPLPPLRLALVSPAKGYSGLPGRTLHAVALTLDDFIRQLALQLTLSGSAGKHRRPAHAAHRRSARRLGRARGRDVEPARLLVRARA